MDEISSPSGLVGLPKGNKERLDFRPLRTYFEEHKMHEGTKRVCLQGVSGGSIIKRSEHTPYPEKGRDEICSHFMEL